MREARLTAFHAKLAWLPDGWAGDVEIAVDADGCITSVTPGREPAPGAVRLAGPVLPGVCNLHSHSFQRAIAGLTGQRAGAPEGDDFWSWRQAMYAAVDRLRPEDVSALAAQAFVEMLRAGFTSVVEFHYLHNPPEGGRYADPAELSRRVVAAAEGCGIGLTLLPVLYMASGFGGGAPEGGQRRFAMRPEEIADITAALARAARQGDRLRLGVAPHSLRAVPPETIGEVVPALRQASGGGPVHIHVAEQRREVAECLERFGRRPVELLLQSAPVDAGWCLIHSTHVTEAELDAIAASGAVVGLCPVTEADLGDGVFPLEAHLQRDGRFGVGTDSNVAISLRDELRLLEYGQRLVTGRRNVAVAGGRDSVGETLFAAALAGGAQASGRPVGAIAPGLRADLVVLDPDHLSIVELPAARLLDGFVFAGAGNPVRDVFVGGRQVIAGGRHTRQDEIAADFRRTLRYLAG